MPSKKTININPSLLKVGSGSNNTTRKKQPKKKPDVSNVKPNTLKKNLLKRLKQHASRENREKQKPVPDVSFSTEFESGLQYLNELKSKKKNKTLKKKEKKKHASFVSLELPPELKDVTTEVKRPTSPAPENMNPIPVVSLSPPPPYGNLKGGTKPTFRQWKNKTQRADTEKRLEFSKAEKINKIKAKIKEETVKEDNVQPIIKRKNKHTKTVKNILGKKDGKIGILIKDNKTRKKVQLEQDSLKTKPIAEVKEFLKKKYLLKVGSKAPPDVLRRIYEDTQLTGDVTNKNTETLLHNYINEDT